MMATTYPSQAIILSEIGKKSKHGGGGKWVDIALNSNVDNVDSDWSESVKDNPSEMYEEDAMSITTVSTDDNSVQPKGGKCCKPNYVIQVVRKYNKKVKVRLPLTCFNFHYSLMATNVCVGVAMFIQGWRWEDITCELGEIKWPSLNKRIMGDNSIKEDSPFDTTTTKDQGIQNKLNQVAVYMMAQGVVLIITSMASTLCLMHSSAIGWLLKLIVWSSLQVWGSILIFSNHEVLKGEKECELQVYLFAFIWLIFAWIQTIGYSIGTIVMHVKNTKMKREVATKSKTKGRST